MILIMYVWIVFNYARVIYLFNKVLYIYLFKKLLNYNFIFTIGFSNFPPFEVFLILTTKILEEPNLTLRLPCMILQHTKGTYFLFLFSGKCCIEENICSAC